MLPKQLDISHRLAGETLLEGSGHHLVATKINHIKQRRISFKAAINRYFRQRRACKLHFVFCNASAR